MRPIDLGNPSGPDDWTWVHNALREIERASRDGIDTVADAFTLNGSPTETRELNVSSPTLANTNAVLATFLRYFKRRGSKRTPGT